MSLGVRAAQEGDQAGDVLVLDEFARGLADGQEPLLGCLEAGAVALHLLPQAPSIAGVSTVPGQTALQVTPVRATSSATARVSPIKAVLVVM